MLIGATGSAINLDATQVVAVAAFLRVINALENVRSSNELLDRANAKSAIGDNTLLDRAFAEAEDAHQVLTGGGLHPKAAAHLANAMDLIRQAKSATDDDQRAGYIADAVEAQGAARRELSDT